jgi:hypothetical protein
MEIKIKPITINEDISSLGSDPQYISDDNGINFQTPFFGAELKINLNSISIQAKKPTDTTYVVTGFFAEEKFLGSSCMCKSFLGKDVTISIEDKVYVGILSEEKTKLNLQEKNNI